MRFCKKTRILSSQTPKTNAIRHYNDAIIHWYCFWKHKTNVVKADYKGLYRIFRFIKE